MPRPVKYEEPIRTFTVRIPRELHRKIKLHSIQNEMSMTDYIVSLISKDLEKKEHLNE